MEHTKVFVGSLPPGTKPEELRHLFEDFGIVVECDVMNRCGFVHMKNAEMADTAITALHATNFKGQQIVVEIGHLKEKPVFGVPPFMQAAIEGRPQGGGGGGRGAGGPGVSRGGVGFPGSRRGVNKQAHPAVTLQLAGVILDLLNDNQNETQNLAGGNMGGGGGGGGDGYMRSGSGGGNLNRGRGGNHGGRGNFQGGRGGGQQQMNAPGPMRNQSYKSDRPAPYNANNGGNGAQQGSGGKFHQRGAGNGGGNYGNNAQRSGNYQGQGNSYDNNWNNGSATNRGHGGRGGYHNQGGRGGNSSNDNYTGGFSGNMSTAGSSSYAGQQDRRGFTLPSNQPPKYGGVNQGGGGYGMSPVPADGGFGGNDSGYGTEDGAFHRRNTNGLNMAGPPGGHFTRGNNRGVGRGSFHSRNDVIGGFNSPNHHQQQHQNSPRGTKRKFDEGNDASTGYDNKYLQEFPPLSVNDRQKNNFGSQNRGGFQRGGGSGGGFHRGGGMGRGGGFNSRGSFGNGGNMNRNAPRPNMPNRRF